MSEFEFNREDVAEAFEWVSSDDYAGRMGDDRFSDLLFELVKDLNGDWEFDDLFDMLSYTQKTDIINAYEDDDENPFYDRDDKEED